MKNLNIERKLGQTNDIKDMRENIKKLCDNWITEAARRKGTALKNEVQTCQEELDKAKLEDETISNMLRLKMISDRSR